METEFLDRDAILSSIERDGKLLSPETVSGEYSLVINGGYMRLSPYQGTKATSALTIQSSEYNKKNTTPFRLPRNIVLTPSDIPKNLSVVSSGIPKDQLYDIAFYGLPEGITPSDIRYYVHYDANAECNISNWQTFNPLNRAYY